MTWLFVVGTSWRTAPLAIREQLAVAEDGLAEAVREILRCQQIEEVLVLSTCNRVEVYGVAAHSESTESSALAEVRHWLARRSGLSGESLAPHLFEKNDDEAIRHLFCVASAIDSLVLGEAQILGQVKSAYGATTTAGGSGTILSRWIEKSFFVAKRVRTETAISRGAANVSSVAVDLAARVFGDLQGRHILIVGAGKMSTLAAKHLRAAKVASIRVCNRSLEKAQELAKQFDGEAVLFSEMEQCLVDADVVITSTGSKHPIIHSGVMKQAMKVRKNRPMVMVDVAVPRDIDAEVGDMDGVYLFDVDDLQKVVEVTLGERKKAAVQATKLVDLETASFHSWVQGQHVVPTIRALRDHIQEVAAEELAKAEPRIRRAEKEEERVDVLRRFSRSVVNRILHRPTTQLKNAPANQQQLAATLLEVFALQADSAPADPKKQPTKTKVVTQVLSERHVASEEPG